MRNWAFAAVDLKRPHFLAAFFALTAVIWGGWCQLAPEMPSVMSPNRAATLECFYQPKSFSEIENTQALLEALALQSISELRVDRNLQAKVKANGDATAVMSALEVIDRRIQEFKGTQQEFLMMNERLILLYQAGLYDRWLDVYLTMLYEHPTHDLVGRSAERAQRMGRETGRELEVLSAFRHLSSIPLEFSYKPVIQAVVRQTLWVSHHSSGRTKRVL